jgi:G:T/U-mismatch repair DNA glycosylase
MTIESHPLTPFLPPNGRVLFLGSFPPPKARWSMEFFYPNWINDFWRVMGLIFHNDKTYFHLSDGRRGFDKERIVRFATEQGFAFFDTATTVRRLKDNASDNYLEILQPTDIAALLAPMPHCHCLVTTGGKASEELRAQLSLASGLPGGELLPMPAIGQRLSLQCYGRQLDWWRMPSTSRAYPLSLEKKAEFYKQLIQ